MQQISLEVIKIYPLKIYEIRYWSFFLSFTLHISYVCFVEQAPGIHTCSTRLGGEPAGALVVPHQDGHATEAACLGDGDLVFGGGVGAVAARVRRAPLARLGPGTQVLLTAARGRLTSMGGRRLQQTTLL